MINCLFNDFSCDAIPNSLSIFHFFNELIGSGEGCSFLSVARTVYSGFSANLGSTFKPLSSKSSAFLHEFVQHSRVWDTSFPNDTYDALD